MPLLSNKLYILNKVRKEKKDDESKFCHPLTNEICETEDEYKRKTFLYNQKIWTCRITGQINLTFKEALKSEQGCTKMLKNSFKKCFEAAVLQFVHHSKESLDTLIHKAWTQIHQEFCVNEPVTLKLVAPKELILKGIVVKVDRSKSNEDKEQDNSPIKLNSDASSSDKENIKKKIIPVKKNYFYSVKIFEMDKLVKDIPAETIERTLRPPSKDQIRMFIRAHAIRHSGKQNNPWVVDDDLVKKYKLPVLEPDFIVDKQKMKELSHSTEVQVYTKMREDMCQRENSLLVDLTKSDDEDERVRVNKKSGDLKNRSSSSNNKRMKQTKLFDTKISTSGTNITATPQRATIRSPLSSPNRSLPPLAQRLHKLMKDTPNDPNIKHLIFKCGQLFSNQQISKFPDMIRSPIKNRKEKLDEKKKIDSMTSEEREAYLISRRNQLRQQLREKKREENAKLEDNEIHYSKEIPEGIPVIMEPGLNQDQWARLVSISEFVRCYKRLLVPSGEANDDSGVINAHELCKSIVGNNNEEHAVLAELVCVLLKTLLQDNRVRNRREMGLGLTELPVTAFTAGELLRLVLPLGLERRDGWKPVNNNDVDGTGDNDNSVEETNDDTKIMMDTDIIDESDGLTLSNNNKIAGPICEKLENKELHQLSVEDKIAVLELLQSRILELDVVSSFIDDYQKEVCEAYKKRISDTKEINDKLKLVRQNKQNMSRVISGTTGTSGESLNDNNTDQLQSPIASTNGTDEASQVMRRRQSIELKLKESEEKERRLEKERQYQKMDKEEQMLKKSIDQCQKNYTNAINDAKQLMRVQPLGSDRHFRRYWHFNTAPGALYVEKEMTIDTTNTSLNNNNNNNTINELTNPPHTQWHMFITADDINELLKSLCEKGIRESTLRTEIETILPQLKIEIDQALINVMKSANSIDLSSQESFLISGYKHELKETELSIRQGSLGGVEDYIEWCDCLDKASTIDELKLSLVQVFLGVHERFWNAPLKSANGRFEFLSAVENAHTQGRLNVLQSFMDACVCWSKSAKDDKCRVCRKNSDENSMLLCDSCNHAFHTFCLRPPLHDIPEGEWFCPHCKPVSRAKDNEGATNVNESSSLLSSSNAITNNNTINNNNDKDKTKSKTRNGGNINQAQCSVCRHIDNNELLAKCTSCKKCFHAQCHEPSLRQIRRTNWHCCECRLDEAATFKTRHSNNNNKHRTNNKIDDDSDNDNDNDLVDKEEEISDHKESTKKTISKKKPMKRSVTNHIEKTNGVVKRKKPIDEVEMYEDDDSEEELAHKLSRPTRKRSRLENKIEEVRKVENIKEIADLEESDQDIDNLVDLLPTKRNNRKRNSNVFEMMMKESKEKKTNKDSNDDENSSPSNKRTPSRISGNGTIIITSEKIEKTCHSILRSLLNHKSSWPFRAAVDPNEVPDYYQIINEPMDLVQMMDKYKNGAYGSGMESLKIFLADIGQIFYNAEVYNLPDSKIMTLAYSLEDFFKTLYNKYGFGIEYCRMTE